MSGGISRCIEPCGTAKGCVMKKVVLAVLTAASFVLLLSCGAGNPIVGKWIVHNAQEEGEDKGQAGSSTESYTFMKDGTVERYLEDEESGRKVRYVYQGNWKYEEPIVTISLGKRGKMNAADAVTYYDEFTNEIVRYGVYNSKEKALSISSIVAERKGKQESEFVENGAWEWTSYSRRWSDFPITNTIQLIRWPKGAQKEESKLDGQASYKVEVLNRNTTYYGNYSVKTSKTKTGDITTIIFLGHEADSNLYDYVFCGDILGDKMYQREVLLKKSK